MHVSSSSVAHIFCVIIENLRIVWRVLLARNQTQQDALHWVKLSGVDEWVDALVEICDDQKMV